MHTEMKIISEEQRQRQLARKAAKIASKKKQGNWQWDANVAAIHMLRVNVKSLAAEARIIRAEEKRCGFNYYQSMHLHRTGSLRTEARVAQLALACLRGRAYRQVEGTMPQELVKHYAFKIAQKLNRKGVQVSQIQIESWITAK